MNALQKLVQALEAIEARVDGDVQTYEYDDNGYGCVSAFLGTQEGEEVDYIEEARGLACDALQLPLGRVNWANIRALKEAGFYVGPGEEDSFGWLTGCINTRHGALVYG